MGLMTRKRLTPALIQEIHDFPFLPAKNLVRYFLFKGKAMDNSPNKTHGTNKSAKGDNDRYGAKNNAFKFDGKKAVVEATGYRARRDLRLDLSLAGFVARLGGDGALVSWGDTDNSFEINVACRSDSSGCGWSHIGWFN